MVPATARWRLSCGYLVGTVSCTPAGACLLTINGDGSAHYWKQLDSPPQQIDIMRFLGRCGHPRNVITAILEPRPLVFVAVFIDTSLTDPDVDPVHWHTLHIPVTDPQPGHEYTFRPRFDAHVDIDAACILRAPVETDSILSLFSSSHFLLTELPDFTLPQACQDAFQKAKQSTLTRFDRIRIYTDGSSNPAYKHWEPALALREGTPDAWAFIALGETFGANGETSNLTLIGLTTQPVSYEQESPYYLGGERIGSDIAEREALFWAGLWRIALNVSTPTVFITDSTTAGQFAFGYCGTTEKGPASHHAMVRGVFQALEAAIPAGGLTLQHVPGHAGEIWNEICDIAAKWSAKTVHWLPRQQVDLHALGPVLPFL